MFEYLVTSSVRRRLLALLWTEQARGSVRELAERAGVAYAAAYRELREMVRQGLATGAVADGVEQYSAATNFPDADLVHRLLATRPRTPVRRDEQQAVERGRLRSLGAPLPVDPAPVQDAELEEALVAGVELARRDPTVATVLPVVFWKQRGELDRERLEAVARKAKEKHAVGFVLALTGELSGDRKLSRLAEQFRDARVTRLRPFFELPDTRSARDTAERRSPEVARRWGYTLNLDLESLRSQFEKFTKHGAL
jgi:hypothetical protein